MQSDKRPRSQGSSAAPLTRSRSRLLTRETESKVEHLSRDAKSDVLELEHEKAIDMLRECLRTASLKNGESNLLRGWRTNFDPDGDLRCGFTELCSGCGKIGYHLDVSLILDKSEEGIEGRKTTGHHAALRFETLDPGFFHLLEEFRVWVRDNFGGPAGMFDKFDAFHKLDGQLSSDEFEDACVAHGFQPSAECEGMTVLDLFHGLDTDGEGFITKDEVAIAEIDEGERHAWLEELRREKNEAAIRMMAKLHDTADYQGLSVTHRLRDRPWHTDIDKLPHVQLKKHRQRLEEARTRRHDSLKMFRFHLQKIYGEPIKGWRRVLTKHQPDPYNVTKQRILQYCRQVDFAGDPRSLWEALDKDRDEYVAMRELCPLHSEALAKLRAFLRSRPHIENCLQWFKETRMTHGKGARRLNSTDLTKALQAEGYPHAHDARHLRLLSQALDADNCKLIGPDDFAWLDGWDPPSWLSASPNEAALNQVKELLVEHFGHVLTAWRQALDTDGSNRLSWEEFCEACRRMQYDGDVPGAWRQLDLDLSGWISLKELCPDSHDALINFRNFVERNFGSVTRAFTSLDADGSGELTYNEFRRACRRMRWNGGVQLLFNALDANQKDGPDGKRVISLKEIGYLDSYADDDLCDRLDSLHQRPARPVKAPVKKYSPVEFDKGTTRFYCTKGDAEHKLWTIERKKMQEEHLRRQAQVEEEQRSKSAGGVRWPDIRCNWRERWHMARTAPAGMTRMQRASSTGALPSSFTRLASR